MRKIILTKIVFFMLCSLVYSQSNWYYQHIEISGNLNSVFFINKYTGWTAGDNGLILKTTNSGKDWMNYSGWEVLTINSVQFTDLNTGWIVGSHPLGKVVFKSTDGGGSWQSIIDFPFPYFKSVYFINNYTGWAVGSNGTTVKTTDGGVTWTTNYLTVTLNSVKFLNENDGVIVGSNGYFYKTTDGGNNWTSKIIGNGENLWSVEFVDNKGWITGDSNIYSTTNGGDNWSSKDLGSGAIYSVKFINENTGWVAGETGKIFKSINGGSNWIQETSNTNNKLNSVFAFDSVSTWAVGQNNTIVSTLKFLDSNDVGVTTIAEPLDNTNYTFNCQTGNIIQPKVFLQNYGINSQNSLNVNFEIRDSFQVVYFDSVQDSISYGQNHMITFDAFTFLLELEKKYYAKSWVTLNSDTNHSNDTVRSAFKISNPHYGYSDAGGYYFLNSSSAASCIPGQPSYNWEDTTGSVSLIVNAQPVIPYTEYNSFYFCGSFRLPDVLPSGRKFKFFGTCYDTIIIANNGVIGFGNASLSRMNTPFPEAIPSVTAPHPAIFPLWYWVNFQDPEITGRNLKYKVTDEKVIITYDRVPLYNTTIDANDYATYQVILETEFDCSLENGKIKVQYNYDKSGSTFINHYNNNGLNEMTVGLQNSTGTIALQYRRSEANHTVTVPGPLFGSPLALEFAPVNSVLPVDLQTFTSVVNNNNVILNWSLNSEQNNSGFEIQRRNSESDWIKINFVNGRGSSSEPNNYSYEDKNLFSGKYNYRIMQIDYNGSFKYYDLQNEVVIGIPEKFRLGQNYPNPFNPATKIDFDLPVIAKISIIVYNVSGREMKQLMNGTKEAGYYSVNFDGTNLASGVYFYSLMINGNIADTKRMVLLK